MEGADLKESWAEAAENSGSRRAGYCKGYSTVLRSHRNRSASGVDFYV